MTAFALAGALAGCGAPERAPPRPRVDAVSPAPSRSATAEVSPEPTQSTPPETAPPAASGPAGSGGLSKTCIGQAGDHRPVPCVDLVCSELGGQRVSLEILPATPGARTAPQAQSFDLPISIVGGCYVEALARGVRAEKPTRISLTGEAGSCAFDAGAKWAPQGDDPVTAECIRNVLKVTRLPGDAGRVHLDVRISLVPH